MRSLQDEIRQAQKDLSCPICARTFQLRDIRVRTFHGGSAELSVICSRGHFPVILIVPVTLQEVAKAGPMTDEDVRIFTKRVLKADKSIKEVLI